MVVIEQESPETHVVEIGFSWRAQMNASWIQVLDAARDIARNRGVPDHVEPRVARVATPPVDGLLVYTWTTTPARVVEDTDA